MVAVGSRYSLDDGEDPQLIVGPIHGAARTDHGAATAQRGGNQLLSRATRPPPHSASQPASSPPPPPNQTLTNSLSLTYTHTFSLSHSSLFFSVPPSFFFSFFSPFLSLSSVRCQMFQLSSAPPVMDLAGHVGQSG